MSDMDELVEDVTEVAEGVLSLGKQKLYAIAGMLSAICGFIGDVLQPIAPFAVYLLIGSTVLFGLSVLFYLKTKKGLVTAVIMLSSTLVLGIVTGIQKFAGSPDNGVAAELIPGVSEIQQSLGLIQQGVEEIKKDTAEIKSSTDEIKANTDTIVETTENNAATLKKISDAIGSDGIRQNPDSPEDYYHNAKLYELGGDYRNAQKSYKKHIEFKTGKLEPHLRLSGFLRANEGRAGALIEYKNLIKGNDTPSAEITKILLQKQSSRGTALKAFQKQYPEYAPVYYYLSQVYSSEFNEDLTLDRLKEEFKWLSQFKELDDTGEMVRYFVDKDLLLEWRADVSVRFSSVQKQLYKIDQPVTVAEWIPTNVKLPHDSPSVFISESQKIKPGLEGRLVIQEKALEIEVKKETDTEFKNLGNLSQIDPETNKPVPNQMILLPYVELKPQKIKVRYKNVAGVWSDAHEVTLKEIDTRAFTTDEDGKTIVNSVMLGLCKSSQNQWCSFRAFDNRMLLYFTRLMRYRSIIKEVNYSLDSVSLDQNWEFIEYDGLGINPIGSDEHEVEVLKDIAIATQFICIQVTYKNGEKSEVVKIANPHTQGGN